MKPLTILLFLSLTVAVMGQDYDELKQVVGNGIEKALTIGCEECIQRGLEKGYELGYKKASEDALELMIKPILDQQSRDFMDRNIIRIGEGDPNIIRIGRTVEEVELITPEDIDRFERLIYEYRDSCYADSTIERIPRQCDCYPCAMFCFDVKVTHKSPNNLSEFMEWLDKKYGRKEK